MEPSAAVDHLASFLKSLANLLSSEGGWRLIDQAWRGFLDQMPQSVINSIMIVLCLGVVYMSVFSLYMVIAIPMAAIFTVTLPFRVWQSSWTM